MNTSMLNRSFTVRQAMKFLVCLIAAAFGLYIYLLFNNAWIMKMGGVSISQMRYADVPQNCLKIIDVHVGSGTSMNGPFGAPNSFVNQLMIQDRVFVRPIESLIDSPECWGFAVRAGIDAQPFGGHSFSQNNTQIIFTKDDPQSHEKKIPVVTLKVEYHD